MKQAYGREIGLTSNLAGPPARNLIHATHERRTISRSSSTVTVAGPLLPSGKICP